jgi:membrane protease subunit HflC
MSKRTGWLLGILGAALLLLSQSVFLVHQTQTAIVLELGKPVGGAKEPGLHFKKPFIQGATLFDARILEHDAQPREILTEDKKAMLLDNFSKWRIVDPLQYYRTVNNERGATARLDDIIYSQLRVALGRYTLQEIVAQKRAQIMAEVLTRSAELIGEYGIELVDVRIKRTDLPPENERAIFGRMRAERERQAKQYRSEGQEEAAKVKSGADRDRALLLADAEREAQIMRGQGDAESARIFGEALKSSPDFYAFKRSLEAYEKSFGDNTRVILSPDSEFLRHFR